MRPTASLLGVLGSLVLRGSLAAGPPAEAVDPAATVIACSLRVRAAHTQRW